MLKTTTMKNNRPQNKFVKVLMLSASIGQVATGALSAAGTTGLALGLLSAPSAAFAQSSAFGSAFVSGGQITPLVAELKQAILSIAPRHGLSPRDYWTPSLEAMSVMSPAPAGADAAFAKAYVDLGTHIQIGRINPSSVSNDIKYSRQVFTGMEALRSGVLNQGLAQALESVAPTHAAYRKLVEGLGRMRALEAQGGFKPLGKVASTLKVGSSSSLVRDIKARASALGYYVGTIDNKFDSQLSSVISDIQESNLAAVTGTLSPRDSATLEWFSVSSTRRIQQMELNLEKYRWLPRNLEQRHIFINLATQRLSVVDPNNYNEVLKNMRVINGRAERKTPSMRDEVSNVVFNPKWTVPPTVFAEDKVTALQKIIQTEGSAGVDAWFAKGRYTVVDDELRRQLPPTSIDWMNLNAKAANFYIVQNPGYDNALGVVKVMLKNPWAIYLHDTNDRDLFTNSMRARSSGCIRMQNPLDMAEYLMRGTKWDRFAIDAYVPHTSFDMIQKESWVKIPEQNKLPVYTLSITAKVGDDNVIRFTQDVYKQNATLLAALQKAGYLK